MNGMSNNCERSHKADVGCEVTMCCGEIMLGLCDGMKTWRNLAAELTLWVSSSRHQIIA